MQKRRLLPFLYLNFILTFAFFSSEASEIVSNIPSLGAHYKLFTFEKNENPQNILVVYTKLDKDCHFQTPTNSSQPFLDYYWLMNRQTFKPVHSLIKSGIQQRLQLTVPADFKKNKNSFAVKVNDLKKLNTDLKDISLNISSGKKGEDCDVAVKMKMDASHPEQEFQISRIYSESKKTLIPPFRKLTSLTLEGVNLKDGTKLSKKYSSK